MKTNEDKRRSGRKDKIIQKMKERMKLEIVEVGRIYCVSLVREWYH
jgi:hypothetical protein